MTTHLRSTLALLAFAAGSAHGSTIFGASTTTVTGQTYTVTFSGFGTTGASMAGMIVTASFTTGGDLTCTWTSSGSCSSGAGGFTVSYPAADSTHPQTNNSNWVITNNRTGFVMSSITFDGIPGLTAFDRCMTGASTFDDTNPGGSTGTSCTTQGTTGSQIGFSVGSGNTSGNGGAGTAGITGTVVYSNALRLTAQAPVGDVWGRVTINFGGTPFTSGSTFTFRMDTDTLTSAVADVPEPGTFAGVGAALLAIAALARRRRR